MSKDKTKKDVEKKQEKEVDKHNTKYTKCPICNQKTVYKEKIDELTLEYCDYCGYTE